jgi:hypothetical protein
MLDSPIARLTLIASVAVTLLAMPFPAASQPAQKVFRVGHVAAGGRTTDGAPPRPGGSRASRARARTSPG